MKQKDSHHILRSIKGILCRARCNVLDYNYSIEKRHYEITYNMLGSLIKDERRPLAYYQVYKEVGRLQHYK